MSRRSSRPEKSTSRTGTRTGRRPASTPAVPAAGAPCPCGREAAYGECCGRLHSGARAAATAESLMRSRYSAFVVRNEAYLLRTWHPRTRPSRVDFEAGQRWTGLEILGTELGSAFHAEGVVVYRAHFTHDGVPGAMTERSTFTRHDGAWVYVDGEVTVG